MTPERWQQIEGLYHAALERPATARAGWLAAACGGDAELRHEVEILLAANDQASGFLTAPALQLAAQSLADDERPTQPLGPVPGQAFSHYNILSRLGAGGMGEVYLAHDLSLERRVALKILPLRFTRDPERLQRFSREAKAASALNHPNIITIYEIGVVPADRGPTHFIATEYIEGVTLRDWEPEEEGKRLRQVLELGAQIASALDAAHQAGIVHRDIKPENLMVRPDGLVKVLDFGLAKLTVTGKSGENQIDTGAQTTPEEMKTMPGMILGTLRYMSPEQARGRALDARTDIFSLGVVLYELLTRQPLFAGESSADVIAAILHKDPPPLGAQLPEAPAELERILRKALAKDCRDRYQTARDLQIDLQALKQEAELSARLLRSGQSSARELAQSGARAVAPAGLSKLRWGLAGALVIGLLGLALSWKYGWLAARPMPRPTPRLTKLMDLRVNSGQRSSRVTFSPDGKLIAYSLTQGATGTLWVRQLTGGPKQISDGKWQDRDPVWSPDGQQLAFLSDRGGTPGVWVMSYLGDSPTLLQALDVANSGLLGWSKKKPTIYFHLAGRLLALDVVTGQKKPLTDLSLVEARDFSVSPNEEMLAFTAKVNGKQRVLTRPLYGGTPAPITPGEGAELSPVWLPDNRQLVFSSDRSGRYQIYLGAVDGRAPEQLLFTDDNQTNLAVSPDSQQLLCSGARQNANLSAVDLSSERETSHSADFGLQLYPELSPDGRQIAFQATNADINLNEAVMLKSNEPGSQPFLLTAPGFYPQWMPNGEALAFIRYAGGKAELRKVSASGRNEKLLGTEPRFGGQTGMPYYRLGTAYQWSPDGAKLVYHSAKSGADNLWVVGQDGTAEQQLTNFTDPQLRLESPHWSPDGKRVAYLQTNTLGKNLRKRSLWVTANGQSEELFSTEQRVNLLGWSASGQELYLASGEAPNLSVPVPVTLLRWQPGGQPPARVTQLPAVYFYSLALAPDRQRVAAVSRETGQDNLVTAPLNGGAHKRVTNNNDPTIYYSGLAWAPAGKTLFFSKQTEWLWLSLVEHFQ